MPKSNAEYWSEKIKRNKERDITIYNQLTELGWNVITVWECGLKNGKREQTLEYLYYNILRNINE